MKRAIRRFIPPLLTRTAASTTVQPVKDLKTVADIPSPPGLPYINNLLLLLNPRQGGYIHFPGGGAEFDECKKNRFR